MTASRASRLAPPLVAGAVATVLSVAHVLLLPDKGTDLAAQLARASFAREAPFTPVDLSWYGGVHAWGYSLVAPWVMALLGVAVSSVLAAALGAALLGALLRDTRRPWSGALLGAAFSYADIASGRTTFALGAAAALGALLVLPRRVPAVLLAVLSALLSPVAAAFLGLAAAVLVLHRRPGGWPMGVAAAAPVVALAWLFPSGGTQPYDPVSSLPAAAAGVALAALTASPLLRTGGLLYAVTSLALVAVPGPFGSNVLRLGLLLAGPLLLATGVADRRHLAPVVASFVWWQVQPTWSDLRAKAPPDFASLTSTLRALDARRVEVVPPRDHGEAAYVAPHVPLARGWSRQVDARVNPLFYRPEGVPIDPVEYRSWLDDRGVDHVAVPAPGYRVDRAGREEALVVGSGRVFGLRRVHRDSDWWVYEVRASRSLVPGAALLSTSRTTWVVRSSGPAGLTPVGLRWSRWLSVEGPACVQKQGAGVLLRFTGSGEVRLTSSLLRRGHCRPPR